MAIALIIVATLAFILVEILLGYLLIEKYEVINRTSSVWLMGVALVVLTLIGGWLATIQLKNPEFEYVVKITDGETSLPLVKAVVELGTLKTDLYYKQETDSLGATYFQLPRTIAGQRVPLRVIAEGYVEWVQQISPNEQAPQMTIKLNLGEPSDSVATLPTATRISPAISPTLPTEIPLPTETPLVLGIGSTRVVTTGMVQVYVPAGEFSMGSYDGEDDERPIHAVYLDAYWIDKTEVTNAHYVNFLNALEEDNHKTGCLGQTCINTKIQDNYSQIMRNEHYEVFTEYEQNPVSNVSWYGAVAFCQWRGTRLPTEAEWEKAARWDVATQTSRTYPWGGELDCELANTNSCGNKIMPVGTYPEGKSPYHAFDMAGNLWEWTFSLDEPYPYNADDGRNDINNTNKRILRGGSWYIVDSRGRSADRHAYAPNRDSFGPGGDYAYDVGFRCVQD